MATALTIPVPGEGVPELGALYLHVQSDGHEVVLLLSIVLQQGWLQIIVTSNKYPFNSIHPKEKL